MNPSMAEPSKETLRESASTPGRRDRDHLQCAHHIGEPQADELDPFALRSSEERSHAACPSSSSRITPVATPKGASGTGLRLLVCAFGHVTRLDPWQSRQSSAFAPGTSRRPRRTASRSPVSPAYDQLTAGIFDEAGIDFLLVGDSAGNNVCQATTRPCRCRSTT